LANSFRYLKDSKSWQTPSGIKLRKHLQVKDSKAEKTPSGKGSEGWANPFRKRIRKLGKPLQVNDTKAGQVPSGKGSETGLGYIAPTFYPVQCVIQLASARIQIRTK
jgi:hypothetical protein